MNTRKARCGALLSVATCLCAASASSASDFYVSPLSASHTASPGEVVSGHLTVVNRADEPLSVSVSLQDFTTDEQGNDTWSPAGSHDESAGDWISFSPGFLDVPATGEATIDYQITVPTDGSLEGSRWAGLVVRAERKRVPLSDETSVSGQPVFGMRVAFAYAIKIYVTLAGTEQPSLSGVHLEAGDQPGAVTARFANSGNVVLRPRVWMEIRNLSGEVIGRVDALLWTLQPRRSHDYQFSLGDLPSRLSNGQYTMAIVADYGGRELVGVSAPLELTDARDPTAGGGAP